MSSSIFPEPLRNRDVDKNGLCKVQVNPRSAGVSGRTRRARGGGIIPPCLTHKPAAVARLARQHLKAPNEYFLREFKKKILKKSQVRSRSDQRSKWPLFALSATEMWLIIAANQTLPKGFSWVAEGCV